MPEGENPDASSVRFAGTNISTAASTLLGSIEYGPTSNAECGPVSAASATSCPPTLVPNASTSSPFTPYIGALARRYLIAHLTSSIYHPVRLSQPGRQLSSRQS